MELYGNDRWWFQTVQSQSINPLYLSTIPAPTLTDSTRRKPIDRKTDYVLSYSHRDSNISALYKRLDAANNREIGHTLDTFTNVKDNQEESTLPWENTFSTQLSLTEVNIL
ncbi:hypothetical protein GQ44DRAFT_827091 [Phaeosphaeriaceae sp. PMI808]|nr:hypothetical protein GQ44DRAFT_827091 [Phaeosphaeriaceae sp. PMI808]